jgi:hypothetical protein
MLEILEALYIYIYDSRIVCNTIRIRLKMLINYKEIYSFNTICNSGNALITLAKQLAVADISDTDNSILLSLRNSMISEPDTRRLNAFKRANDRHYRFA